MKHSEELYVLSMSLLILITSPKLNFFETVTTFLLLFH